MLRGLIAKSVHETRLSVLLFGLGLAVSMGALTVLVPQVQKGLSDVLQSLPFVQTIISTLMGINVEDELTAQMMQAFVWVYPVVLALTWAAGIMWCTRVPCGEIDRGTIDILLGWPVSRRAIILSETFVWAMNGLAIIVIGVSTHLAMQFEVPTDMRAGTLNLVRILVNLFALYLAVCGIAWLCSCVMERRTHAIGTVFAIVLCSFLINFIVQVWPRAEPIAFLSVLRYYRPAVIIRSDAWPITDLAVLFGVGIVTWLTGSVLFARRAIRTT